MSFAIALSRGLSRCYEGTEASARARLEVASVGYLAWRRCLTDPGRKRRLCPAAGLEGSVASARAPLHVDLVGYSPNAWPPNPN